MRGNEENEIVFWGHRAEDGRVQPLIEHLRGVSKLTGQFAAAFVEGEMGQNFHGL